MKFQRPINRSKIFKIAIGNKYRIQKIILSILVLVSLSFFSFQKGLEQNSLYESVKSVNKKYYNFPYLKIISFKSGQASLIDKWGYIWNTDLENIKDELDIGMLLSFKGKINEKNEIHSAKEVTVHRGYKFKMYVSIIALLFLLLYYNKVFSVDSNGIYRKNV